MRIVFIAVALLALSHSHDRAWAQLDKMDTCRSGPAQSMIGVKASKDNAAKLLRLTRAREIRWVAPQGIVTQEYKLGRLTVGYDKTRKISSISCG